MRLPADCKTQEEVLSECLADPDTLLILLVAGFGTGGASNALRLTNLSGCPMFNQDEVTQYANQLVRAGLMRVTSHRNAVLTQAGLSLLLLTTSVIH